MKRKRQRGIKILVVALLAMLLGGMLGGCGRTGNTKVFSSLEDFEGSTLGSLTGGTLDQIAQGVIDDTSFNYYQGLTDEVSALTKGDIDGIVQDLSVASYMVAQHPEFAIFPEEVAPNSLGFALPKDGPYTEEFTEVIQDLYADGTIEELQDKWFSGDEERMVIDWDEYDTLDRGNGVLHCAYEDTKVPVSYEGDDGQACGYEPELLLIIADRLGLGIDFQGANFSGLISFVESGKADVACGGIAITEERAESVDFPESHYIGGIVLICRADEVGAVTSSGTDEVYTELSDFEGATFGMLMGAAYDQITEEKIKDVTFLTYNDLTSSISALEKGDVDGVVEIDAISQYMIAQRSDLSIFPEYIQESEYSFVFQKGSPYTDQFSEIIEEFYEDGTIEDLQEKWLSGDEDRMVIDWDEYDTDERANGTLRYVCTNELVPFGYEGGDGKPLGYEVELLLKIADRLDMGVDWGYSKNSGLISYIESGKADVISDCMTITPERQEVMDFSEPTYQGGISIICRNENLAVTATEEKTGFWAGLAESFEKTFIREDRWKLIGSGLLVTLEITGFAALFGTFLGFGMCLLLRSKNRVVSTIADLFCKLISGIPAVVILMVVYFVIFASSGIAAVAVGVIVFTILFTVSVGGLLTVAIDSIAPRAVGGGLRAGLRQDGGLYARHHAAGDPAGTAGLPGRVCRPVKIDRDRRLHRDPGPDESGGCDPLPHL